MTISMYQASVPVFTRNFQNLIAILRKAEANAAERKVDTTVLLNFRLAPDMFTLTRQVQIATDVAKGCAARLAGQEPPSWEDKEATMAEVIARVQKCLDFLATFKPAQIDGSEKKAIKLKVGGKERSFEGLAYLQGFATPNVYFHTTVAYAILRHCGVPLGKGDFLGE